MPVFSEVFQELSDPPTERRTGQIHPRFARVGRRVVRQFSAVGTASENGAISASKVEPPAVTIW